MPSRLGHEENGRSEKYFLLYIYNKTDELNIYTVALFIESGVRVHRVRS